MLQKLLYGHQDDTQTNYDAIRYSFMLTAIAVIHFIFMVIFFIMGVTVMGIYNTAIVILYAYLSRVVSNIKASQPDSGTSSERQVTRFASPYPPWDPRYLQGSSALRRSRPVS